MSCQQNDSQNTILTFVEAAFAFDESVPMEVLYH